MAQFNAKYTKRNNCTSLAEPAIQMSSPMS